MAFTPGWTVAGTRVNVYADSWRGIGPNALEIRDLESRSIRPLRPGEDLLSLSELFCSYV